MALDFIKAAQAGTASVVDLGVALVAAAVIGSINGVAVFLKKKLFWILRLNKCVAVSMNSLPLK